MATELKPCKHCNVHKVARDAKSCPNCGGRSPYPPDAMQWGVAIVVFVVFIGAFAWCLVGR